MISIRKKMPVIAAAAIALFALSGCGSSNTISSLTDSDTATSSVISTAPAAAASTATAAPAATASTAAAVPQVTPSAVTASTASGLPTAASPSAVTTTPAVTPAASASAVPAATTLADSAAESVAEEEFVPAGEGNTAKTTTDVNFRSEPDVEGDNVIAELDEGTEVTVLGREGDFFKVEYDGETGYISQDYLE